MVYVYVFWRILLLQIVYTWSLCYSVDTQHSAATNASSDRELSDELLLRFPYMYGPALALYLMYICTYSCCCFWIHACDIYTYIPYNKSNSSVEASRPTVASCSCHIMDTALLEDISDTANRLPVHYKLTSLDMPDICVSVCVQTSHFEAPFSSHGSSNSSREKAYEFCELLSCHWARYVHSVWIFHH